MLHTGQTRRRKCHRHTLLCAEHGTDDTARADVLGHPLAQLDLVKGVFVAPKRRLSPGTRLGIVIEHFRHPLLVQLAQILNAGHCLHDNSVQSPDSCPMVASVHRA